MTQRTPVDIFLDGARKGWTVGINSIVPNLVMAFALIQVLKILGVLEFIGKIFGFSMSFFGLPGEAVTVLLAAWLSMAAGVGVAASLYEASILNSTHITIILPAIYLMGAQIQYMGRLLGVSEVPRKHWPLMFAASVINALVSMLLMKCFV